MNSLVAPATENSKLQLLPSSSSATLDASNSRPANANKTPGNKQPTALLKLPFRTRLEKAKNAIISKVFSNTEKTKQKPKKKTMNPPQAARPSRLPGGIIDLTSSDEEGDDVEFATPPESPAGRMNAEARALPPPRLVQFQHQAVPRGLEVIRRPAPQPAAPLQAEVPQAPPVAYPQPNGHLFNPNFNFGDYYMGDEDNDEALAHLLAAAEDEDFQAVPLQNAHLAAPRPQNLHNLNNPQVPGQSAASPPPPARRNSVQETLDECLANLMNFFPGIDHEYVVDIYNRVSKSSDRLISYVLDKDAKGTAYPKTKPNKLKRKREVDPDEELVKKYSEAGRNVNAAALAPDRSHYRFVKDILSSEFSTTPMVYVETTLNMANFQIFPAYRILDHSERNFDQAPAYNKIKTARKPRPDFSDAHIQRFIDNPHMQAESPLKVEIFKELQALRRLRAKDIAKANAEKDAERAEEENTAQAIADGTMSECGCCCDDFPLNRMIHCSGDESHWFCRGCALRNAETAIGQSKYELLCMSTDGCTAGYSNEQRKQFLNENTRVALERCETEANLRMAGIENLASCPFCPYAAEYPPVEIDREFRCQNPDCEKVSCRLCSKESHIPKSCAEHEKENGLSIRRQVEEAMSAALIRTCNKCKTPFVKEEGCNKMTCTLKGCMNIQCYVCSESCGYDHFNDERRGGKAGNCPLFESVEDRHDGEVTKAQKEALEKVLAEHPEYTAEDLKIQMSSNVAQDDATRKARDAQRVGLIGGFGGGVGAAQLAALQARMAAARQGIYMGAPPAGEAGRLNGRFVPGEDFEARHREILNILNAPRDPGRRLNPEQGAEIGDDIPDFMDRIAEIRAARARRIAEIGQLRRPRAGAFGEAQAFGAANPPIVGIQEGAGNGQPPADDAAELGPEPDLDIDHDYEAARVAVARIWNGGLRRGNNPANRILPPALELEPQKAPGAVPGPDNVHNLRGRPPYVNRPELDAQIQAGPLPPVQNGLDALRRRARELEDDVAALRQMREERVAMGDDAVREELAVLRRLNAVHGFIAPNRPILPPRLQNRKDRPQIPIRSPVRDAVRAIDDHPIPLRRVEPPPARQADGARHGPGNPRRHEAAGALPAIRPPRSPRRRSFNDIMERLRAAAGPGANAAHGNPNPNIPVLAARPALVRDPDDDQPQARYRAAANVLQPRPFRRVLRPGALDDEFPPLVPLRPAAAVGINAPRPAPRLARPGAWIERVAEDNAADLMNINEDE